MNATDTTPSSLSQCDRIFARLVADLGQWVSMPDLAQSSGSYNVHSRISDLRRRGHHIDQRTDRKPDGTNASFYKLVSDHHRDTETTEKTPASASPAPSPCLRGENDLFPEVQPSNPARNAQYN